MIAPTISNIQLSIWRHTAIPHTVAKAAVRCSRSHSAAARHLLFGGPSWSKRPCWVALWAYLCTREQRREALARTFNMQLDSIKPPLPQSASRRSARRHCRQLTITVGLGGSGRPRGAPAARHDVAVDDPRQTMSETIQEALR